MKRLLREQKARKSKKSYVVSGVTALALTSGALFAQPVQADQTAPAATVTQSSNSSSSTAEATTSAQADQSSASNSTSSSSSSTADTSAASKTTATGTTATTSAVKVEAQTQSETTAADVTQKTSASSSSATAVQDNTPAVSSSAEKTPAAVKSEVAASSSTEQTAAQKTPANTVTNKSTSTETSDTTSKDQAATSAKLKVLAADNEIDSWNIGDSSRPRVDAVDVSSWQSEMSQANFNTLKEKGVTTVIVKLTEGNDYTNPYAIKQIKAAVNAVECRCLSFCTFFFYSSGGGRSRLFKECFDGQQLFRFNVDYCRYGKRHH